MTYQPYPYPNRTLVRAIYQALQQGIITRAEFAACLITIMGVHR